MEIVQHLWRKIWLTPNGRRALWVLALAAAVFFLAPASLPEAARRALFIFVFAAFFWALEIIPLYATSLLVILLEILLLARPGGVLGMDNAGYEIFLMPFGGPVIMLFFGGFVLAGALQKYHLDRWIATHLLNFFGEKPYSLMLGFMCVTAFLSMWMSNTAATAMMMAMVLPLLKQLNPEDPFRTGLLLSIPFAANIGGIGTPVGTPPNAIAIGILANYGHYISFMAWMKMALPLAVLLLFLAGGILYAMFPPKEKRISFSIRVEREMDEKSKLTMLIAAVTVILWLTSGIHEIPSSVIALISAGLFSALGLMKRDDFKTIDWDVLILMWGGLALGKGMELSGLTNWFVSLPLFDQHGFLLVVVCCLLALVLSTVMSHTAAANLMIPIAMGIPGESHILLAATIALSCSFAMALPVSTPPNAIAFATNMIKSKDMFKSGIVISLISTAVVLLGFKFVITQALGLH